MATVAVTVGAVTVAPGGVAVAVTVGGVGGFTGGACANEVLAVTVTRVAASTTDDVFHVRRAWPTSPFAAGNRPIEDPFRNAKLLARARLLAKLVLLYVPLRGRDHQLQDHYDVRQCSGCGPVVATVVADGGKRGSIVVEVGAPVTGQLVHAVVALTRTKRRRYLWCAWWLGAPCADPFRPPDAWNGGASTEEEALREAEARAGQPLTRIEGRWAGAWMRVRAGQSAFVARAPARVRKPQPIDPHSVVGVTPGASLSEIKAQFRQRALQLHPDHGGDSAAFIALKRAYDSLVRRRSRQPSRDPSPQG